MRHAYKMHAREVHAHEMYVHTNEMHARKVHAYETRADQMHAHEVHAHEMHTREVYAHEIHAHEIHAHEMHELGRCREISDFIPYVSPYKCAIFGHHRVTYRPRFGGDSRLRTLQLVWTSPGETQLGRDQLYRTRQVLDRKGFPTSISTSSLPR